MHIRPWMLIFLAFGMLSAAEMDKKSVRLDDGRKVRFFGPEVSKLSCSLLRDIAATAINGIDKHYESGRLYEVKPTEEENAFQITFKKAKQRQMLAMQKRGENMGGTQLVGPQPRHVGGHEATSPFAAPALVPVDGAGIAPPPGLELNEPADLTSGLEEALPGLPVYIKCDIPFSMIHSTGRTNR